MASCCGQNFEDFKESNRREDLINMANQYAAEQQLDATRIPLGIRLNLTNDHHLAQVFQLFVKHIQDKEYVWKHGILALANHQGQVLELTYEKDLPLFLQKKDHEYFDCRIEAIGANAFGLTAKTCKAEFVNGKEHFLQYLHDAQTTSVPIFDSNQQFIGILGFISKMNDKWQTIGCLQGLLVAFELALTEHEKIETLEREAKKREALLEMTQTLYSTMDVNEVLSVAIHHFQRFYPNVQLELWLTQELLIPNLPIKQMTFIPNSEDINGQAFLEGKLIRRTKRENRQQGEIAAPLKGKQGIYGVIHIACQHSNVFTDEEISFISSVADIIGTAFEKARLYQQSNNLVKELQVINDLTKRLNQSLTKDSILQFVLTELGQLFDAEHVFVLEVNDRKDILKVIASNSDENVGTIVSVENGYMGLVYKNKEPIIISDTETDLTIKDAYAKQLGCRSLMSVPILSNDEIIGILSVSNQNPLHFSYDNFKMLQVFAQHLGLALTNAILHERLQQLAITDYLTGLYNRSYLDEKIQQSMNGDEQGSILLLDIDDFKKINDTYGHQVGDQILVQVAMILISSIRDTDTAVRWGGEEIALYLPNVDPNVAKKVAFRILNRISQETNPKVTVSCGLASWKREDQEVNRLSLFRMADKMLYEAKNSGKNQVRVFQK
ncbi:MAG: diguanylate cyclase [Tepidibacillus sp.]|uniref:sensor domain-containing diguanylate cyclase n=1 Tax=Tepidibacillus sp. HK-1 TaxID=1883407 RepID=UPI0008530185|nr:sensor domain-containing diguanylate cyclase [Tepidibacillus sp. HK-1]GBF10353.1 response regulator PleD [Tepidibacillus sp. HK-1]